MKARRVEGRFNREREEEAGRVRWRRQVTSRNSEQMNLRNTPSRVRMYWHGVGEIAQW